MTLQMLILDSSVQIKEEEGVEVINAVLLINYFRLSVFLATCAGQLMFKKKKKSICHFWANVRFSCILCNGATAPDDIQNRDLLRDQDK